MELWDYHPPQADFSTLVTEGLSASPKWLPALMLYNERGSELFDKICEQPEYYLTRAEQDILETQRDVLMELVPKDGVFLELGSGNPDKARHLFDAMEKKGTSYFPLDISREYLEQQMGRLRELRPNLSIHPVCANFLDEEVVGDIATRLERYGHRIAYFPGSTIGNMFPETALKLMENVHKLVGPEGDFLVAIDLKKDRRTLEAAYDDAAGVTAAFEKNVLRRMNADLGANFDLDAFQYRAHYLEAEGRVEMVLVSEKEQAVTFGSHRFNFGAGESLHVENSFKYTIEEFQALGEQARFQPVRVWTDSEKKFSLHHWRSARI